LVSGEGGVQLNAESGRSASIPDQWLVIEVTAPAEAEDATVETLLDLGGRAVEQRDGLIITHVDVSGEPEAVVCTVRERLARAGFDAVGVEWRWQPHEAWEELWKQGLGLRVVTERIGVLPSWCEPEPPLPEVTITIDPGMAFGTAEHATTRGCLRLLDRAVRSGQRILDAGSGSAILSIAAVKLGARTVKAVELDPYACEAALENVQRNSAVAVDILNDSVTPEWLATQASFDGVLANMQTSILNPLLRSFRKSLVEGGWMILSGVLDVEWDGLQAATEAAGFSLVEVDSEGEWRSGWFIAVE
jgi:ribosomal protein L11 methyltransferase